MPVLRERAAAVDELREMLPAERRRSEGSRDRRACFQPARFGGCEADLAERRRGPRRRGPGLRLERLVHGPAHHAQLHALALARPRAARHMGRGSGLLRQRHLHSRACGRGASRRGRLCVVGPLAADQRRQYQRLVPVRRPAPTTTGVDVDRYFALPREPDRDRRYLAVGRPEGLGEQRCHRRRDVRARAPHPVDQAPQGRSYARQCASTGARSIARPSYCIFGVYISAALSRHRRGRTRILSRRRPQPGRADLAAEGQLLPHAAGQGGGSVRGDRRRATAPVQSMCDEASDIANARRRCRATSKGRSFVPMPRSPGGWPAAPSSCCGMPAPAAASTATIRCRASIATSASPAATSRRTGTPTARPMDAS